MRRSSFILLTCTFLFLECIAGPWVQKPSLPGPGRHRGFSFVISDKAYVGGGWNGMLMFGDFWEFDPASNSWTQRANILGGSAYTSCGVGINGKGYLTWGTVGTSLLEYDPVTNSWTFKASCPTSTWWESNAVALNGKMYLLSGTTVYSYDPALNSWTSQVSNTPSSWAGQAVSIGNMMYLCFYGGTGTFKYDPSTNVFTQMAIFPGESRGQASAFAAGGKMYGGVGDGIFNDNINDFWEYDPVLNSWKRIDDLPGDTRENAVTFTVNNRGYICTGTNGINHQDLWMLVPENITSLGELDASDFSIFPNPVESEINITFSEHNPGGYHFELFSSDGKKVMEKDIRDKDHAIHRNDLTAGLYYYRISMSNSSITGKLILK